MVVDASGEICGDVPNIAARAQALAEPGAVVVTALAMPPARMARVLDPEQADCSWPLTFLGGPLALLAANPLADPGGGSSA